MKITEFNTSYIDEKDRLGLKPFKMFGLADIVLLTGPNGAGKSRILRLLKKQADSVNNIVEPDESHSFLFHFVDHRPIKTDSLNDDSVKMFEYVPKKIELRDWRELKYKEWNSNAKMVKEKNLFGHQKTDFFAEAATSLIQYESNRYWNTSHQSFKNSIEKKEARENFKRLNKLIKHFLGTRIERNADGESTLFGYPIADAKLSEGQIILLQLCVEFYVHNIDITDFILVMDEPENHLHPSAAIQVIDKLREVNPNGQIWVATHSLALISHFDPDCIWYVDKGEAHWSSHYSEVILKGLIGDDDDIEKLRQFTDLPNQFGTTRFSAQCLLPPTVAETGPEDSQFKQIKKILDEYNLKKEKLKLLDYGAGKGRLISAFAETGCISRDVLDYYAYDKFGDNKKYCINNIRKFYGDEAEIRYLSKNELVSEGRLFDIVLMCNVLHEIEYKEWEKVFNQIGSILKTNGHLLLVEDNRIPVGELPNKSGFLVLNTEQLNVLFNINPSLPSEYIKDAHDVFGYKEAGRLMAHLIPVEYLKNVNKKTIKDAIKSLKDASEEKIKELRRKKTEKYKIGMEYGFWLNQYANASLCLNSHGKSKR